MPGVPERAGKGTTGELVKDLVFQVQDQFFEADRVRVQHRSGKPMDEMPEIMETDWWLDQRRQGRSVVTATRVKLCRRMRCRRSLPARRI